MEKDYYPVVSDWMKNELGCSETWEEHRFDDLVLLSGDIVGLRGEITYACELKAYPFPIGASGYGSVGQALALKSCANKIYIGCIASDREDDENLSWRKVSKKSSICALIKKLNLEPPMDFESYCRAVRNIFNHYFGDLGLGLLVIHEMANSNGGSVKKQVKELVKPK